MRFECSGAVPWEFEELPLRQHFLERRNSEILHQIELMYASDLSV